MRRLIRTPPSGASAVEYLLGLSLFSVLAWHGLHDDWFAAMQSLWRYSLYLISSPTT
ncbi:MAG: hypothetical protein ACO24G_01475 [Burkholderiaceae bacterium]|jgi:hypothetical protein